MPNFANVFAGSDNLGFDLWGHGERARSSRRREVHQALAHAALAEKAQDLTKDRHVRHRTPLAASWHRSPEQLTPDIASEWHCSGCRFQRLSLSFR